MQQEGFAEDASISSHTVMFVLQYNGIPAIARCLYWGALEGPLRLYRGGKLLLCASVAANFSKLLRSKFL